MMPQFRLTKKFSTDCKIKKLDAPTDTLHQLDDWFLDRIIVDRKKIAVITHAKTTYTFFIPYAEAGSAEEIIPYFIIQLKKLFQHYSLIVLVTETEQFFNDKFVYTKTVDRKILGHMNDFIRCAEPFPSDPRPINWQDIAERINNMPIHACSPKASYPIEKFNTLLGINLPKRK